jgi:hypothetical protein
MHALHACPQGGATQMRQSGPSPRSHASTLPRDRAQRLLRAVEEMRELDRARQLTAAAAGRRSSAGHGRDADRDAADLARKVEAKAREIFRLAQTEDDASDRPAARRRH